MVFCSCITPNPVRAEPHPVRAEPHPVRAEPHPVRAEPVEALRQAQGERDDLPIANGMTCPSRTDLQAAHSERASTSWPIFKKASGDTSGVHSGWAIAETRSEHFEHARRAHAAADA